ncbi:BPI fold-containing family B member 2 [Tenrec ecaudatus]|uniref:BPI fold-containing family B member 2 n=1 Tax=Tenrec ecaudatus TaxID=94439 RepID=UPI003F595FAD
MWTACRLGQLLVLLLLPMGGTSMLDTVVRLNQAALSYVSEIGKAPLQRALHVTLPYFLDQSGEVLQPTRVQMLKVHVPRLHLNFMPDFGVHLLAAATFSFEVFRNPEQPLVVTMPVVLLADVRVAQGTIQTPVVSIPACYSFFGNISMAAPGSTSSSPALLIRLQKHIKAVLSTKLCLSIANLVQDLNVHLGTLIGLNPVGPESQIRYSMANVPTITNDYISLDVNALFFLLAKPIILPMDSTNFMVPHQVGTKGAMATVGLSQDMFDSALLLLHKAGSLNLDITGQLNSDDNPLNTSTLGQLIPEVARQFPEPMPVVLKVQLGATPIATLRTNNATLRLQPFIEVLAMASNSACQSLFSLDVVVNLSLQLFVSGVRLQGTTSVLGDVQLTVASSNVGSIDMDQVHILMGTVFEKPLLDHFNALLGIGVPLPNVVNLRYASPKVFIYEGYAVVSSGLLYQQR